MKRLRFLQLAIAALFAPRLAAAAAPCPELRRRVRQRLILASEDDNCGAPNDYADGYRQCGRELLGWWDAGMPKEEA